MTFECLKSIKVSMCDRVYTFNSGQIYTINSDKNNSELEIFENFLKQKGDNFRILSGPKLLEYRSLVPTQPTFIINAEDSDVLSISPSVPFKKTALGKNNYLITSDSFIANVTITKTDGTTKTYEALPAKPVGGMQQENLLKFYLSSEQYKNEFSFDTGLDISSIIFVVSIEKDGGFKIINNADITYKIFNNRYVTMVIDIKDSPAEIILTIQVKG